MKPKCIVWYEQQCEHNVDVMAIGPFDSFADAQRWTVNQTQENYPGRFQIAALQMPCERVEKHWEW